VRIIFMGTPEFAVPALRALTDGGHQIMCVITQPDRPRGRGYKLAPPPVKVEAERLGLPVLQPENVSCPEFVRACAGMAPDVAVLAAFGQKISGELLAVPRHGFINIHPSLLPKYRGAAPIERAIMNGDSVTGVTIMYMDEGWDTGDTGIAEEIAIPPDADRGWLEATLADLGGELILRFLRLVECGEAPRVPQDHSAATYASKLSSDEVRIDWRRSAREIHDQIRALSPVPGARTSFAGQSLRILRAHEIAPVLVESDQAGKPADPGYPGMLTIGPKGELIVFCGPRGCERIAIDIVHPAGKREMPAEDFARGRRIAHGDRLGSDT
jgi:methionyl-tRNA formyltransferase